jgi:cellulose synthase/poly-beta-1,6-N-acetylglucosamine synthase-like glycosyltransferase
VRSLKKQTLSPLEIILVVDPDEHLVGHYKAISEDIKIVVSAECGLSNARNVGVASSRGDIIAFIDDDAIADEEWLQNMVRDFDDPAVIGVGGSIIPVWDGVRPKWFPSELDWIIGCIDEGPSSAKVTVKNPWGCNMAFRRSAFERVGLFDLRTGRRRGMLRGSEEAEFGRRLLSAMPGSKIIHDPAVIVHHRVPKRRATLSRVLRRSFQENSSEQL